MIDEGYGNGDLKLRLGQLQDALLRDARFVVGIKIHTGQMTFDQGVDFFVKEATRRKSPASAKRSAARPDPHVPLLHARQTRNPEAARRLQERCAAPLTTLEDFHNKFLSQGMPPIKSSANKCWATIRRCCNNFRAEPESSVAYSSLTPTPGGNCWILQSWLWRTEPSSGRSFGAPAERSGEVSASIPLLPDTGKSSQILVYRANRRSHLPPDWQLRDPLLPITKLPLLTSKVSSFASFRTSPATGAPVLPKPDGSLPKSNIPVVSDLDTRALVQHLRSGVMRGVLSAIEKDTNKLVEKARSIPSMAGLDLATRVSTQKSYEWSEGISQCSPSILLVKTLTEISRDRLRFRHQNETFCVDSLHSGCKVTVVPSLTPAEDVLALKPDGVFLSNGPGDPEPLHDQIANVRRLIGRRRSSASAWATRFGLALGGKTYKLKFSAAQVIRAEPVDAASEITITAQSRLRGRSDSLVQMTSKSPTSI